MKILKRIILFLAIILSVLWIEIAHADMGAPELREFEIVVINNNGVDYYDYKGDIKGHLDKNDTVLVLYEYDGQYTIGKKASRNGYEFNETIGYINSLDGFSLAEDEVDPTKLPDDASITKYDEYRSAIVYAKDGVDVYKGPSDVYDKVGHINKDTVLSYKYAVETYDNVTNIYISNKDVKGWVEILDKKVLIENDTQYIFRNDVNTECGTIPKNSITTPKYKTDSWSHSTLFEYNDCKFLYDAFRDEDVFAVYPNNYKTLKDITLYETSDSNSKEVGTVPSGSEIIILSSGDYFNDTQNIKYIKYDELTGWAIVDDESLEYISENDEKGITEDTIKITEEEKQDEDIKPNKKPIFSINAFIIVIIVSTFILVLTGVIIAILVNRTSKNKKIESKKEEEK